MTHISSYYKTLWLLFTAKKQDVTHTHTPPAWFWLFGKFCLVCFVCADGSVLSGVSTSLVANMGATMRSGPAECLNDVGHRMLCFWLVSLERVSFLCSTFTGFYLCSVCRSQPPVTITNAASRGCFHGQGLDFISELSGHWIQFSRDSNVSWAGILMLFYAVLIYSKLTLEFGYGCPFSRSRHVYLKASSLSCVK